MVPNKLLFILLLIGLAIPPVNGQGTFRNLDFELANVPALPPGQYGSLNGVLAADAIPYWSVNYGSFQSPNVTYNNYTGGNANVSIFGPSWDNSGGLPILAGNYSAYLEAGLWNAEAASTSIAQTGAVPSDAKSIRILLSPRNGNDLGITFAGQSIPVVTLANLGNNDWIVGGDVSAYAGTVGQLRLTALGYPGFPFTSLEIDNIVFSNQAIPEPRPLVMLLCSGAILLLGGRLRLANTADAKRTFQSRSLKCGTLCRTRRLQATAR